MKNKPRLARVSLVIFINVQFPHLLPPLLGHLSLRAHTNTHTLRRCLLPLRQRHHSQQEGRKYSFLSGLLRTKTTGCYRTVQQSLLCLVADLDLSHTGITTHTHRRRSSPPACRHTRANPERRLFIAHINVSNQSGQGAL